ncbi:MAG: hypothetical protein U0441_33200 [Polyangiaceae bacterium]
MTLIGAAAVLAGCSADPPRAGQSTGEARSASVTAAWESKTLPWGAGSGEVAIRKGAPDFPAEGPSSVAVAPNGEVLILDRWNERVIGLSPEGAVTTRAAVPSDVEHLAVSPASVPGFALAAWSPLHGKVTLLDRAGASLGEVAIPRELTDTARIEVGLSHRVAAVSAYQETVQLGSPRAPLDLAAASRTRKEGAAFLADGRGVAALVTGGSGQIVVYAADKLGDDEKPPVAWTYPISGSVSSVRVIGAVGKAICARLERVTQASTGPLSVDREVLCVEAGSSRVLLQRALGRPGIAAVHEDLAVGGEPLSVAYIRPDESGLHVERLPLNNPATDAKEVGR